MLAMVAGDGLEHSSVGNGYQHVSFVSNRVEPDCRFCTGNNSLTSDYFFVRELRNVPGSGTCARGR